MIENVIKWLLQYGSSKDSIDEQQSYTQVEP